MHKPILILSLLLPFAAGAAPLAPPAMTLEHEDFVTQLLAAASVPGTLGPAAQLAAAQLAAHNATEERVVLPLLDLCGAVADAALSPAALTTVQGLGAELPALAEAETAVIAALVDLYATADAQGRPDIARLAERMIWHEVTDAQVLYPAARLASQTATLQTAVAR